MTKDIIASDDFFTLLKDNKPKKIGQIKSAYFTLSTSRVDKIGTLVKFDFDNTGDFDLFFFYNNELVINLISEKSYCERLWLYEKNLIQKGPMEFVNKVVEEYTFKEIGF